MNTKTISRCAFITALSFILLYLSVIMDTLNIFMLTLSTSLLCLIVDKDGLKSAFITYIAISLVNYLLLPDKFLAITYFVAFGNYAFIKYFIEKFKNIKIEVLFKFLVANIYVMIGYYIMRFFVNLNSIKLSFYLIVLLGDIVFFVCDFAISVVFSYINVRISKLSFWRK